MDEDTETHEGIHVWQQLECGVVGGLLVAPLLAVLGAPWWAFLVGLVAGFLPGVGWFYWVYLLTFLYWTRVVQKAHPEGPPEGISAGEAGYFLIPFEREAYLYGGDGFAYFKNRRLFAWLRIADDEARRKGAGKSETLYRKYQKDHFFSKFRSPG